MKLAFQIRIYIITQLHYLVQYLNNISTISQQYLKRRRQKKEEEEEEEEEEEKGEKEKKMRHEQKKRRMEQQKKKYSIQILKAPQTKPYPAFFLFPVPYN